jgi:hypothetical protein
MAGSGKRDAGCGEPDETSGLEYALSELRADVPVRAAWRQDVLAEVRDLAGREARVTRREGWTISPLTAIAAALAFTALGAVATVGVFSLRDGSVRTTSIGHPDGRRPAHPPQAGTRAGRSPHYPVRFAFVAPGASRVALVGDFNRWDASATPMRPAGDGRLWMVEVPLPPGRHVYAFVVDGDLTADPAAPRAGEEDFGVPSSVVLVGMRGS